MKIKKGDTVKVIAGSNKNKTGKVMKVLAKENRVIVEGVNIIHKHQKQTRDDKKGGIIQKEAPIHASNVMLLVDNKPTRVGYKIEDGKKVRFAKKTGKRV